MKGIKIVASNEAVLHKAAVAINASLVKLTQINDPDFLYYKIVNPFSQQDILPGNSLCVVDGLAGAAQFVTALAIATPSLHQAAIYICKTLAGAKYLQIQRSFLFMCATFAAVGGLSVVMCSAPLRTIK